MNENEIFKRLLSLSAGKRNDFDDINYWHYTSLDAIYKIFQSKELWFSHYKFLNDPQEIIFGINAIRALINGHDIFKYVDLDEIFNKVRNDLDKYPIFILSTSKEKDSLSQWFLYGDDGKGVAINLSRFLLNRLINTITFKQYLYYPVSYYHLTEYFNEKEYEKKNSGCDNLEKCLNDCLNLLYDNFDSERNDFFKELIIRLILIYSATIKNSFYKSENEFRIVLFVEQDNKNIDSLVINNNPRVVYKLPLKNNFDIINEVMLGPKSSDFEIQKYSLERKISSKNKVVITKSESYMK